MTENGERVRLFRQMGRGMNPWAIGIASNMYFINRIKLIPLEIESKTCRRLNLLDLHARFRLHCCKKGVLHQNTPPPRLKHVLRVGGGVFEAAMTSDQVSSRSKWIRTPW